MSELTQNVLPRGLNSVGDNTNDGVTLDLQLERYSHDYGLTRIQNITGHEEL